MSGVEEGSEWAARSTENKTTRWRSNRSLRTTSAKNHFRWRACRASMKSAVSGGHPNSVCSLLPPRLSGVFPVSPSSYPVPLVVHLSRSRVFRETLLPKEGSVFLGDRSSSGLVLYTDVHDTGGFLTTLVPGVRNSTSTNKVEMDC